MSVKEARVYLLAYPRRGVRAQRRDVGVTALDALVAIGHARIGGRGLHRRYYLTHEGEAAT